MTDEALARETVSRLAIASAPERHVELRTLWDALSPEFNLVADRLGTTLDAGAFGIVRFTHRTMLLFWLLSFATWKAVDAWLVMLKLSKLAFGRIYLSPGDIGAVPDQSAAEQAYANALAQVHELSVAPSVGSFSWPSNVPVPGPNVCFTDTTEQAAFELCVIATGFAFLHECHHLQLAGSASGADLPNEELECDAFARDFLLEQVAVYSASSCYSEELVREKRALGCALNGFFILALTPKHLWNGSATHPPVAERFRRLFASVGQVAPDGHFYSIVASFLVSHLHLAGVLSSHIEAPDERSLCIALLDFI